MREKELNSDADEVKCSHIALFCLFFRREKEFEAQSAMLRAVLFFIFGLKARQLNHICQACKQVCFVLIIKLNFTQMFTAKDRFRKTTLLYAQTCGNFEENITQQFYLICILILKYTIFNFIYSFSLNTAFYSFFHYSFFIIEV